MRQLADLDVMARSSDMPVPGLVKPEPGREKPERGRPLLVMGLTAGEGPDTVEDWGLRRGELRVGGESWEVPIQ